MHVEEMCVEQFQRTKTIQVKINNTQHQSRRRLAGGEQTAKQLFRDNINKKTPYHDHRHYLRFIL